jgi:hypothetical protein
MRKVLFSLFLAVGALAISIAPALAGTIGPTP